MTGRVPALEQLDHEGAGRRVALKPAVHRVAFVRDAPGHRGTPPV